jgi:hypothetical protein
MMLVVLANEKILDSTSRRSIDPTASQAVFYSGAED